MAILRFRFASYIDDDAMIIDAHFHDYFDGHAQDPINVASHIRRGYARSVLFTFTALLAKIKHRNGVSSRSAHMPSS